jgi:hypothetical protein
MLQARGGKHSPGDQEATRAKDRRAVPACGARRGLCVAAAEGSARAVAAIEMPPPTETRGKFNIEADKLDTWNAVGQIVVRTPGVTYEGRSQMMDLYSVRYRDVEFMILTRALLLSDTIKKTTTLVTATTPEGKPIDSDAVVDLLAMLQRDLPAEIVSVQERQAAEAKAKKAQKSKAKKKKHVPRSTARCSHPSNRARDRPQPLHARADRSVAHGS